MKISIDLLKRDKGSAGFCFLFFVISTTIISFYMNLLVNKNIKIIGEFELNILISLSFAAIAIVILLGFYANQVFLNTKTKMIAIFELCGVGILKIMWFLLLQSVFLLLLALPLGMIIGIFGSYLFSTFILDISGFYISYKAIILVLLVLFIEVIYLALVATGFVYRNEIISLLGYQRVIDDTDSKFKIMNIQLPKIMSLLCLLFFVALVMIVPVNPMRYLAISILAIYLFTANTVKKSIYSLLRLIKSKLLICKTITLLSLSHSYILLRESIVFIQLIGCLMILVVCCFNITNANTTIQLIIYSMYLVLLISLFLAFSFKMILSIKSSLLEFKKLKKIGYSYKELTSILRNQIVILYSAVSILIMVFPIISSFKLYNKFITLQGILFIFGSYLLVTTFSSLLTYYINRKMLINIE